MTFAFPPRPLPTLPVAGGGLYPVARIFCAGRNYADHAAEMGNAVPAEPFWFTKSPFALVPSGSVLPYPPGTADLHHEVELVVALGEGGAVWGHAAGLDMTRRDLQARAKAEGKPWDTGKDFEGGAVVGALTRGPLDDARLTLTVNGAVRQDGRTGDMVADVPRLLAHLASLYSLGPGDIVMTGTPAGVGAVVSGDVLEGTVEGLEPVRLTLGPKAAD